MPRDLPSAAEAAEILSRKRTRPVRRPPPLAARSLAKPLAVLEARFAGAGPGPRVLTQRWGEVVGEMLARRTEPVKLVRPKRGGAAILEIRVDGPAAALIQHQAPDILARANLILGSGAVDRLRIVQGLVRPPPASATGLAAKTRRDGAPLDAAAEAELCASLAKAVDNALKTALLNLGRGVLRRERAAQRPGEPRR